MEQISLTDFGMELVAMRSRKRDFLDEMNLVILKTEPPTVFALDNSACKTVRPGTGQEHRPAAFNVRDVQFVDGAQTNNGSTAGVSVHAVRKQAQTQTPCGKSI
jgi:hypothetical protein